MTYEIKTVNPEYIVTAYGVTLGDFNDWEGNNKKIAALKAEIEDNGSLEKLLSLADGKLLQLNSAATNGGPWRGFGVKGDFDIAGTEKITILAKDHAVFSATVSSKETGADELTGKVFGGMIGELTGYKYVGPYNLTTVTEQADGTFLAEMWLPVEKA